MKEHHGKSSVPPFRIGSQIVLPLGKLKSTISVVFSSGERHVNTFIFLLRSHPDPVIFGWREWNKEMLVDDLSCYLGAQNNILFGYKWS